jgi:hypothetical protein
MADQDVDINEISRRLQSIELRLSRLESGMTTVDKLLSSPEDTMSPPSNSILISGASDEDGTGLESKIGRFGLAWLGNVVLLFGITFLSQYLMNIGHLYFACFIGYFATASIFLLANYLKKTNDHLAFMFRLNAQILLFYITMRLHFFSASPLISNKSVSIILLLGIIVFQTILAIRNKSQFLALLALFFSLLVALLGDATHFTLPIITLGSAGVIYYYIKFNWRPLIVLTIFLTYISFSLWLFGNPVMGHQFELIPDLKNGVIYLFLIGAAYSILLFFRNRNTTSDDFLIGVTLLNGVLFSFLLLLVVLRFYYTNYVLLFSVISICCLIYSTILHSRSEWNFGSAYFALYGFMAMSIALYGLVGLPEVYLLLSFQSLLVVSMALWFRNRLIVVMNSLLFLTILLVYIFSSSPVNGVNFSFAIIALVSARIINWKKSRLKIETDLMRNLYMIEGFLMVLYGLSHALPKQFVTVSWTIAALLYFLISILLKNVKYRYMALGTMICAAIYLFLIDLARIEIIYRVLALLLLATISIGISMYYTNRAKKSDK